MPSDTISLRSERSSSTSFKGSIYSDDDKLSDNTVLYSELRLIERNEGEINVCWKGAHMMLFFMAFVFGSLCTCCFHRVMFMFDEKCVLFPKVVSHNSIHRIIYEFFSYKPLTISRDDVPENKVSTDFVSTQWAENSVCYLPTYVPLVSGLAGLVWTTMFLMCSSGTSNVTGAQRHWRALPAMFFFSMIMSVLCIYASCVTQSGLQELCSKLAEAIGSPSCMYNINVATLVYERRIHGVYQAARLSIVSAWLHTACWVLSTLLIAARVLLAVDFTLVHVKAQLVGNLDDILQKHEKQIDSFNAESATPLRFDIDEDDSEVELFTTANAIKGPNKTTLNVRQLQQTPQLAQSPTSSPSEGRQKLLETFMRRILLNVLKVVGKSDQNSQTKTHFETDTPKELTDTDNTELLAKEFIQKLRGKLTQEINDFEQKIKSSLKKKDDDVDTEGTSQKIDGDTKKYETDKDPKNKIDAIKYGEIEQRSKNSSREIYEINLEEGTSQKIEEKDKNNKDMSLEILNIQYSTTSYENLKKTEVNSKTDKDEKENEKMAEEIELKDIKYEETIYEREQHISDDPDDDNKSSPSQGYDKTDKYKKKKEKQDDTKDGKGPQGS